MHVPLPLNRFLNEIHCNCIDKNLRWNSPRGERERERKLNYIVASVSNAFIVHFSTSGLNFYYLLLSQASRLSCRAWKQNFGYTCRSLVFAWELSDKSMRSGSIRWICKYTFSQSYRVLCSLEGGRDGASSAKKCVRNSIILFSSPFERSFSYLLMANSRYHSRKEENLIKKNYNNHTISYPLSLPASAFFIIMFVTEAKLFLHFLSILNIGNYRQEADLVVAKAFCLLTFSNVYKMSFSIFNDGWKSCGSQKNFRNKLTNTQKN